MAKKITEVKINQLFKSNDDRDAERVVKVVWIGYIPTKPGASAEVENLETGRKTFVLVSRLLNDHGKRGYTYIGKSR